MNDLTKLPHRFLEKSFRRYEVIISSVCRAYPNVIDINPEQYSLSQATFSCRFRDAVKSFSLYSWSSSIIERDLFNRIFPKDDLFSLVSVSESKDIGLLRIGGKVELKRPDGKFKPPFPAPIDLTPVFDVSYGLPLEMICRLADARLLTQVVKCKPVTYDQKVYLEQKYDVSIDLDPATNVASIL